MRNALKWILFVGVGLLIISLPLVITGNKGDDLRIAAESKLDSILTDVQNEFRQYGSEAALQHYLLNGMDIRDNKARVVIELKGEKPYKELESVANTLRNLGGVFETYHSTMIRALVPLENLSDIAQDQNIMAIRTPLKPIEAGVKSEGVSRSGADLFQNAPSFGGNNQVKIALLDTGFKGYISLLGTELPAAVQTKNFCGGGNFEETAHGTACAEIVHDMAPTAEIYLVALNDDVGFHQAVDWLISEKVDVISSSIVWYCDAGALDGTGPICEDVKKAYQNGILWVQAMGNYNMNYWENYFIPMYDNPNYHQFGRAGYLQQNNSDVLAFKATKPFTIYLSWNDWGIWDGKKYSGSSTDFGIDIVQAIDIEEFNPKIVYFGTAGRINTPNTWNAPYNLPIEKGTIPILSSAVHDIWGIKIFKYKETSKQVRFRLYIIGTDGPIEYAHYWGSMYIPADASDAISVNGVGVDDSIYNGNTHRQVMSTIRKPELAGYSGISTASMGRFEGTSAAAAHVAGAVGLLKSKLPFSNEDIKKVLFKRAIPLYWPGSDGWDEVFGYGRLNLLRK